MHKNTNKMKLKIKREKLNSLKNELGTPITAHPASSMQKKSRTHTQRRVNGVHVVGLVFGERDKQKVAVSE